MVDIVDMLPGPRGGHLPGGDALERGLYLQRHDDVPLQCALQVRQLPPGQQGTGVVKVGIKTKTSTSNPFLCAADFLKDTQAVR